MANLTQPLWEVVRDKYITNLKPGREKEKFQKAFNITISKEDIVQQTQKALQGSRDSANMSRFSRSIDLIMEISPAFDVVAQVNGLIGCSVWAPLRLILMVSYLLC